MSINLIIAMDEKNGIGKNNALPWHIKGELKQFKDLTTGNIVIMGKNTFESIGHPLPDRENFVISSTMTNPPHGVTVFKSLKEAITFAVRYMPSKSIWISGGARIFEEAINGHYPENLYITRINGDYDCDVKLSDDWDKDLEILKKLEVTEDYTRYIYKYVREFERERELVPKHKSEPEELEL